MSHSTAQLAAPSEPGQASPHADNHRTAWINAPSEDQEARAADSPATHSSDDEFRQQLERVKTVQLQRLAKVDRQIAELKAERDRARQMCDHACGLLDSLDGRKLPKTRVLRSRDATFDAVAPILTENPGPMHYREMYRHLQERGFEIEGKDPGNSLLARITSDPRIERAGRGFYRLASRSVAA